MKIGNSIKYLRTNISKEKQCIFADRIGISQSYLSQIENNQKEPSTDLLQSIAKHLNTPLPVLFWYAVTEEDIAPDKMDHFLFFKPVIDKMMKQLF